jgi:hypothetical protein
MPRFPTFWILIHLNNPRTPTPNVIAGRAESRQLSLTRSLRAVAYRTKDCALPESRAESLRLLAHTGSQSKQDVILYTNPRVSHQYHLSTQVYPARRGTDDASALGYTGSQSTQDVILSTFQKPSGYPISIARVIQRYQSRVVCPAGSFGLHGSLVLSRLLLYLPHL